MGNAKLNVWFQWLLMAAFVVLLIGSFTWMKPVVNVPTAQEIAGAVVIPTMQGNLSLDNDKIDAIYNEIFKDDTAESKAESLALDEMDTKDFKKALVNELLEYGAVKNIDYKDINRYSIRDTDVTLKNNNKADVDVEFKVYFNNFGDEEDERVARVEVTFKVSDLDEDEDFEDAEVTGFTNLNKLKLYSD
ncbi:MAG: hypothetical protein ACTSXD_11895 [Candidatus Heimdallarchaeaceae archaeon]